MPVVITESEVAIDIDIDNDNDIVEASSGASESVSVSTSTSASASASVSTQHKAQQDGLVSEPAASTNTNKINTTSTSTRTSTCTNADSNNRQQQRLTNLNRSVSFEDEQMHLNVQSQSQSISDVITHPNYMYPNYGSTNSYNNDNNNNNNNDDDRRFDWDYIENGSPNQSTTLLSNVFQQQQQQQQQQHHHRTMPSTSSLSLSRSPSPTGMMMITTNSNSNTNTADKIMITTTTTTSSQSPFRPPLPPSTQSSPMPLPPPPPPPPPPPLTLLQQQQQQQQYEQDQYPYQYQNEHHLFTSNTITASTSFNETDPLLSSTIERPKSIGGSGGPRRSISAGVPMSPGRVPTSTLSLPGFSPIFTVGKTSTSSGRIHPSSPFYSTQQQQQPLYLQSPCQQRSRTMSTHSVTSARSVRSGVSGKSNKSTRSKASKRSIKSLVATGSYASTKHNSLIYHKITLEKRKGWMRWIITSLSILSGICTMIWFVHRQNRLKYLDNETATEQLIELNNEISLKQAQQLDNNCTVKVLLIAGCEYDRNYYYDTYNNVDNDYHTTTTTATSNDFTVSSEMNNVVHDMSMMTTTTSNDDDDNDKATATELLTMVEKSSTTGHGQNKTNTNISHIALHCNQLGIERSKHFATLFGHEQQLSSSSSSSTKKKHGQSDNDDEHAINSLQWPFPTHLFAFYNETSISDILRTNTETVTDNSTTIQPQTTKFYNLRYWESLRFISERYNKDDGKKDSKKDSKKKKPLPITLINAHTKLGEDKIWSSHYIMPQIFKLLKHPDVCGTTIVIAWQRESIIQLANLLGCSQQNGCPKTFADQWKYNSSTTSSSSSSSSTTDNSGTDYHDLILQIKYTFHKHRYNKTTMTKPTSKKQDDNKKDSQDEKSKTNNTTAKIVQQQQGNRINCTLCNTSSDTVHTNASNLAETNVNTNSIIIDSNTTVTTTDSETPTINNGGTVTLLGGQLHSKHKKVKTTELQHNSLKSTANDDASSSSKVKQKQDDQKFHRILFDPHDLHPKGLIKAFDTTDPSHAAGYYGYTVEGTVLKQNFNPIELLSKQGNKRNEQSKPKEKQKQKLHQKNMKKKHH